MADDEPAAKRAKNESDEASDDEDDQEIIIDGEKFNVDDLQEESDDDDDDDDDDESDEEDEDADSDVFGGNVYIVTHHQEKTTDTDPYARKLDCEIVGVAGTLEKAEDIAREYAEAEFEEEVQEDFHGWFAEGFEAQDDESPDLVHKVLIEVHEIKN
jgi:hypothetical protein